MAERAGRRRVASLGTRAASYFVRHAQTLVGSLGRLASQPFATFMTAAVIGIALALPAALHLARRQRARARGPARHRHGHLGVPQEGGLARGRASAWRTRVEERSDVGDVELIPADVALQRFREGSAFGQAVEALEENPLPHTLIVQPAAGRTGGDDVAATRRRTARDA